MQQFGAKMYAAQYVIVSEFPIYCFHAAVTLQLWLETRYKLA